MGKDCTVFVLLVRCDVANAGVDPYRVHVFLVVRDANAVHDIVVAVQFCAWEVGCRCYATSSPVVFGLSFRV